MQETPKSHRLERIWRGIKTTIWQGIKKILPRGFRLWLRETKERWLRIAREWLWERHLLRNVQQNYAKKIKELSNRKDGIKCVFFVSCNTKWNGDALYKKLDADSRFAPMILYLPLPSDYTETNEDDNRRFFTARGYHFAVIADAADLQTHKPDIVFFQQPWAVLLKGDLTPASVSKYALCLYFHYGISAALSPSSWDRQSVFYKTLCRNFVFNSAVEEQFNTRGAYNTLATGHPKMDAYLEPVKINPWKDIKKFKIIYAPHHSIDHYFSSPIRFATFDWNGRELLDWAKIHTDTEWVFKPHPRFRYAVLNSGIMNEAETDDYYGEWNKIGTVYEQGDYFDMFRTADLLITDCFSFLTEWLPTEKPCIHLLTVNDARKMHSPVHEKSSRHYYKVQNIGELNAAMEMLAVRREDPMKAARIHDAKNIPMDSAKNIYQWLIDTIGGEQ